jgi:hypothetical protein
MHVREQPGHRRNIDNRTATCCTHRRLNELAAEKRAPDIYAHCTIEHLNRHRLQRLKLNDASIVDKDIDTAKTFGTEIDDRAPMIFPGYVVSREQRLAGFSQNIRRDGISGFNIDVSEKHAGPARRKQARNALTQPPSSAGDDRGPSS